MIYIAEEAIALGGAAVIFYFFDIYTGSHVGADSGIVSQLLTNISRNSFSDSFFPGKYVNSTLADILKYTFLGAIVLSRCGLYGFEVGEITLLQQGTFLPYLFSGIFSRPNFPSENSTLTRSPSPRNS